MHCSGSKSWIHTITQRAFLQLWRIGEFSLIDHSNNTWGHLYDDWRWQTISIANDDWQSVSTSLARFLFAKPHSCDVESLISAYNVFKDDYRCSFTSKTLYAYLLVHVNMTVLSKFLMCALYYENEKDTTSFEGHNQSYRARVVFPSFSGVVTKILIWVTDSCLPVSFVYCVMVCLYSHCCVVVISNLLC